LLFRGEWAPWHPCCFEGGAFSVKGIRGGPDTGNVPEKSRLNLRCFSPTGRSSPGWFAHRFQPDFRAFSWPVGPNPVVRIAVFSPKLGPRGVVAPPTNWVLGTTFDTFVFVARARYVKLRQSSNLSQPHSPQPANLPAAAGKAAGGCCARRRQGNPVSRRLRAICPGRAARYKWPSRSASGRPRWWPPRRGCKHGRGPHPRAPPATGRCAAGARCPQ
jgi:hypothetical protein